MLAIAKRCCKQIALQHSVGKGAIALILDTCKIKQERWLRQSLLYETLRERLTHKSKEQ